MAAVQTTYAAGISAAVAGLVANMETQNSITRLCEPASLGFGKAAFQGTADNEVNATSSGTFRGITMIDTTLDHTTADQYEAGDNVALLEKGVIWVLAGGTVNAGEAVHIDGSGDFIESASGSVAIPNAFFEDSGADGDLVRIRLK